jgi:hypothetical protein
MRHSAYAAAIARLHLIETILRVNETKKLQCSLLMYAQKRLLCTFVSITASLSSKPETEPPDYNS